MGVILEDDVLRRGPGVEGGLDSDTVISIGGIRGIYRRMRRDIDLVTGKTDTPGHVASGKIVERHISADNSGVGRNRDCVCRGGQANQAYGTKSGSRKPVHINPPE